MWYAHATDYHSDLKEILTHATTRTNLKKAKAKAKPVINDHLQ